MHPKNYIRHLNKHNLSAEELWLCHCIFLWKDNDEAFNKSVDAYVRSNKQKFDYTRLVDSLVQKGLLLNIGKKNELKIENLLTTKTFREIVVVDIEDAFLEVLKVYPDYLLVDGRKTMTKSTDIEALKQYYNTHVIKGSRFAHEKYMMLNEKYFEHKKYANMGIDKWIRSWLANESLIEKEIQENIEDDIQY